MYADGQFSIAMLVYWRAITMSIISKLYMAKKAAIAHFQTHTNDR